MSLNKETKPWQPHVYTQSFKGDSVYTCMCEPASTCCESFHHGCCSRGQSCNPCLNMGTVNWNSLPWFSSTVAQCNAAAIYSLNTSLLLFSSLFTTEYIDINHISLSLSISYNCRYSCLLCLLHNNRLWQSPSRFSVHSNLFDNREILTKAMGLISYTQWSLWW